MKNILLSAFALAALAIAPVAHASTLTVSLQDPNQSGTVGDTLIFYGVITNTSGSTVNLDSDDISLSINGATLVDGIDNTPETLAPYTSSPLTELFDVVLSGPFAEQLATYNIYGDTNPAPVSGEAYFSVTSIAGPPSITPEPSSFLLLLTGLPAAILPLRKRVRR